ncbi:MAG TPA: DUF5777 family beta-barrel protein [Cyclobacteriaceae bacterium]|nr:DUF5777 family beta-barrel protein [Cyclobacteriaceae bacterium]
MKSLIRIFILLFLAQLVNAQDDLLKELDQQDSTTNNYTFATFKGSRIINGQSVETRRKGELEFIFSHRFGLVNGGAYTLWGLDESVTRLGLEYGITDRFGVGVGRTSSDKTYDGYVRYKLLRQKDKGTPVTITAMGTFTYQTFPNEDDDPVLAPQLDPTDRMAYTLQAMIARKFNTKLSLQVNPIFVHRNTVDETYENNDDFALGFAGRYKITRSMAISAEYVARLNAKENVLPDYERYDAVGIGFDIETGGHVFQLLFTNTLGMFERWTITKTNHDFFGGDIHFGFNITRTFQLSKKQ